MISDNMVIVLIFSIPAFLIFTAMVTLTISNFVDRKYKSKETN